MSVILGLAWLVQGGNAHAAGYSADIELLRPTFSDIAPGVDSAAIDEPGMLRVGVLGQYERNPLVLWSEPATGGPAVEQGAVISNRGGLVLGASYDASPRFSVRASLPTALQWGSAVPSLAGDGVGIGDAVAGARVGLVTDGALRLSAHGDLALPTGTQQVWLGEGQLRGTGGLLFTVRTERVSVGGDVAVTGRGAVATTEDFQLGPELVANAGASVHAVPGRFAVQAALLSRAGFANFLGGGAENSLEALLGARAWLGDELQLDVAGGHGIGGGYGTTDLRVVTAITWRGNVNPAEEYVSGDDGSLDDGVDDGLTDAVDPDEIAADQEEAERKAREAEAERAREAAEEAAAAAARPKVDWKENELARQIGQRIIVRDPIQFAVATDRVLPDSVKTLEYMATLLTTQDILIIEGHASEEGDFKFNYDLSLRRAKVIYEELVRAGVPPARLSYRGMGEVSPVKEGSLEADLAANRRVVFYVVRLEGNQLAEGAAETEIQLPWNGKTVKAREFAPPAPEAPAAPATPTSPPAGTDNDGSGDLLEEAE